MRAPGLVSYIRRVFRRKAGASPPFLLVPMNAIRRRAIEQAQSLTRDVAAELGLEIVEFDFHDQGRHSRLRVDVDRAGVPGVTLADCERLILVVEIVVIAALFNLF